jgi:hypothetical protein
MVSSGGIWIIMGHTTGFNLRCPQTWRAGKCPLQMEVYSWKNHRSEFGRIIWHIYIYIFLYLYIYSRFYSVIYNGCCCLFIVGFIYVVAKSKWIMYRIGFMLCIPIVLDDGFVPKKTWPAMEHPQKKHGGVFSWENHRTLNGTFSTRHVWLRYGNCWIKTTSSIQCLW